MSPVALDGGSTISLFLRRSRTGRYSSLDSIPAAAN